MRATTLSRSSDADILRDRNAVVSSAIELKLQSEAAFMVSSRRCFLSDDG
jgi:hypothetical protein